MMSEPKPFASLSSGLLARKGAAKPAMRPQGYTHIGANLEDLGWNDMGHAVPPPPAEHVPSSISALTPLRPQLDPVEEPTEEQVDAYEAEFEDETAEQLTEEPAEATFAAEPEAEAEDEDEEELPGTEAVVRLEPLRQAQPEPVDEPVQEPAILDQQRALEEHYAPPKRASRPVQQRRPQPASPGSKAAFTLRLDSGRHLKLRLACALTRRSAQQIVTEALDSFMNTLPEVEALAQQVPAKSGKHGR